MDEKMSYEEMIDNLRKLRNMTNAVKLGQQAQGIESEAFVWEQGAKAAQQALVLLGEAELFRQALESFFK